MIVVADESAAFHHVTVFTVVAIVCPEFDSSFGVEKATAGRLQNVQPNPGQTRVGLDLGRAGVRVPGAEHVFVVVQGEGRVTRAHQGFGGGRRVAVVGGFATFRVRQATSAGAGRGRDGRV